jgi:His/Glu/Gln/Arg/opine family amino acid ABC transporter permease subunit
MSEIYKERKEHKEQVAAERVADDADQARVQASKRALLLALNVLFFLVAALLVLAFLLYLYSYHELLTLYLPVFLSGLGVAVWISLVSVVLAVIFGLLGAFGRLSRFVVVRWIVTAYVEVVRGTPVLVQMLLWYFGVGAVLTQIGLDPYRTVYNIATALQINSLFQDSNFDAYLFGIIGLSFNYGAYLTEVFRSGIQSVERGQSEAALSLGMNSGQIMRQIILPQAIRVVIPPFTNNFITLIQDSALLSIVGLQELEHATFALALPQTDPGKKMFVFIFGALFYLVLCYPLSLLARYFEARIARAY